jgi:hypothetical protein
MTRIIAIIALLVLSACAGSSLSPPSNITNACVMKAERPEWFEAMSRTQVKWGPPVSVQLATIYRESKFVGDAKTPKKYAFGIIPRGRISSAYGYAQAIDGTWDWYRDDTGRRFASRTNFSDASDFIGWYMNRTVVENGIPVTDAYRQYLAYHEGHAGYRRGSYRAKAFLLRAADEVKAIERRYAAQLRQCS